MNRIHTFFLVTFAVILGAIISLITNYNQQNDGHLFKAPFASTSNTQEYSPSILQDSEKDIVFIENLGQITDTKGEKRPDVLFLTRSGGVDMYMTNSGISYVFRNAESGYYRLDMEFVGMNEDVIIKKELAVEQQFNYYTPEYPDGISPKAYKKLIFENLYEDIDLAYYENEGRIKYDFIIKAGADAGKIKMRYTGAGSMDIDDNGNVIITTPMGEIMEEKPYSYAKNTGLEIASSYLVKNNTVLFDIAQYDESEDIIIDPVRKWATYYGGLEAERGAAVCTDNNGNLYVAGRTWSSNFPLQFLAGAYNQSIFGGGTWDAFILKFNSDGDRLWATYYGGTNTDDPNSICTDNSGNLYVTGETSSANFPIQNLTGAYNQTTPGGSFDAFILKFNNSGVRQWATYYGGTNTDYGYGICSDNSGNLYVIGATESADFPVKTLSGAYNQTTSGGSSDSFILKLNSNCARQWATYYGGSDFEGRYESDGTHGKGGVCSDNADNIYITGTTASSDFPTQGLLGAYNQALSGGGSDAYILKFNTSGVRQWATYYGGIGSDGGGGICADSSGNLYVTGITESSDFPTQTLAGAYNQTNFSGNSDAFILKFTNCVRQWATYYGGNDIEFGNSICTDNLGNFYVAGDTRSNNFPIQTSTGAYNQTTVGGGYDAYILEFDNNCVRQWASYYGGSPHDRAWGICTDNAGNTYVTGNTRGNNFPLQFLIGAYNQSTHGGSNDAFILRFLGIHAAFNVSHESICESDTVNFTDQSLGNVISWNWTFEGGNPWSSTAQHPTVRYNSTGNYDVRLIVSDGTLSDTIMKEAYITVLIPPSPAISGPENVCSDSTENYLTTENPGNTYEWEVSGGTIISGAGTHEISVEWGDPGIGYVLVTEDNGSCSTATEQFEINIDSCISTSIRENDLFSLNLYPNPAQNVLNIDLSTFPEIDDVMISLITIHGYVIKSVKFTQGLRKTRINTSAYAPGLYFVQVFESDRVIATRKVIIDH